jgi:hypothetical protein
LGTVCSQSMNQSSTSWLHTSRLVEQIRRHWFVVVEARKESPDYLHHFNDLDHAGKQHLALAIIADQDDDLLGLESVLVAIEDRDISLACLGLEMFEMICMCMHIPAIEDLLGLAIARVATAVLNFPDEEILRHQDSIVSSVYCVFIVSPTLSVGLLDRESFRCAVRNVFRKNHCTSLDGDVVGSLTRKRALLHLACVCCCNQRCKPEVVQSLVQLVHDIVHPHGTLRCLYAEAAAGTEANLCFKSLMATSLWFMVPLCLRLFKQTPEALSVVMAPVAEEILKHVTGDVDVMVAKLDRLDHILLDEEVHVVSRQSLKALTRAAKQYKNSQVFKKIQQLGQRSGATIFCGACGQSGEGSSSLSKCAECCILRYCCVGCQKEHWPVHKLQCTYLKAQRCKTQR